MMTNPMVKMEFEVTEVDGQVMLGVSVKYTDNVTSHHLLLAASTVVHEVAKVAASTNDAEFADNLTTIAKSLEEVTATREVTSDQMF